MIDKKGLQNELNSFNNQINDLLEKRKKFLDEYMSEFAEFKIGEQIYDMKTLLPIGYITGYYRNPFGHPLNDDSFCIYYYYQRNIGDGMTLNTSSQMCLRIGNKNDVELELKRKGTVKAMRCSPDGLSTR